MLSRPRSQQSWRALVWCAGFMLVVVGAAQWWMFDLLDSSYDAAYAYRRQRLRQELKRDEQRPLVVTLGSSRMFNGVDGAALEAGLQPAYGNVRVVNFASVGAGPINSLALFGRLLRDGLAPDTLIVEVLPCFLMPGDVTSLAAVNATPYSHADKLWLAEHGIQPDEKVFSTQRKGLAIWEYRADFLRIYASAFSPGDTSGRWVLNADSYGSLLMENDTMPEERRAKALEHARHEYEAAMGRFEFGVHGLQALEAIAQEGQQRQIQVAFVLMPEGDTFRTWYRPGAREEIHNRLTALADKYQARLVDTLDLLADAEFLDSHHLLQSGSTKFSAALGQQVGEHRSAQQAIAAKPTGETKR